MKGHFKVEAGGGGMVALGHNYLTLGLRHFFGTFRQVAMVENDSLFFQVFFYFIYIYSIKLYGLCSAFIDPTVKRDRGVG